jgi:hypothetical protein
MKSLLLTMVPLILLSGFAESASHNQSTVDEWQGEWGQWLSDGKGHIYGASISIFACDSAARTCRFRYHSESAESRCSSSTEDGYLLRINGSVGKAQFFDSEGKPIHCYLDFEKTEASGKRELRLMNQSGEKCADYCTGKLNFPSVYPFKSSVIYPLLSTGDCFADSRKSRDLWCTDPKIQRLDQELNQVRLRIDSLTHTNKYRDVPGIRKEILDRCNQTADVGECLFSSFTRAVADMELSEKKAKEAYEKEEKALLTHGDPIQGSLLISRIEGVYKKRFKNKMADGTEYTSENVLEIVRVSKDTVYFRTRLQFYNGASCGLSGLARYSLKGVLVFKDPESPPMASNGPCLLQFEETAKEVRILDPGGPCARLHCGIRGGFDHEAFSLSARRPIRYLERLKKSEQYLEALKQLKE